MVSSTGSSSAWGTSVNSESTARVFQVLVGHEIFEDGTLPPLHVGDVVSVRPDLAHFGVVRIILTCLPAPIVRRDLVFPH